MTFEEYIKEIEVYGKIDTEQKLSFYKRHYGNRLLKIEDEKNFEPLESYSKDDLVSEYDKNLDKIFGLSNIKENQFYFLVKPSDTPEKLLIITKELHNYLVTLIKMSNNYWGKLYYDRTQVTMDTQELEFQLNKTFGDKLFTLLNKTINEDQHPKSNLKNLGGDGYYLSKKIDGKPKVVFKVSPCVDSTSGKIIFIMQSIMEIENINHASLDVLDKKIDELL